LTACTVMEAGLQC